MRKSKSVQQDLKSRAFLLFCFIFVFVFFLKKKECRVKKQVGRKNSRLRRLAAAGLAS